MAQVPFNPVPSTLPTALPDNYRDIQASPDAFGAQVGQSLAKLGGSIGQASDVASQVANMNQNTENQINATNALTELQKTLDVQSFGDPKADPNDSSAKGFYSLKGASAVNSLSNATDAAEQARTDLLSTMNPAEGRIFDEASRRMIDQNIREYSKNSHGK